MTDNKKSTKEKATAGISDKEESYRFAKLLRAGERELMRQLNTKKSKKLR